MDIETLFTQQNKNDLTVILGVDHQEHPFTVSLPQSRGLLMLGSPSLIQQHLWTLLLQVVTRHDPNVLQIVFLNNQSQTAMLFGDLPLVISLESLKHVIRERQYGTIREPFILFIIEDVDQMVDQYHEAFGVIFECKKWGIGVVVTASSSQVSPIVWANTSTTLLLSRNEVDLLKPEEEEWVAPIQLPEGVHDPLGVHMRRSGWQWLSSLPIDARLAQQLLHSYKNRAVTPGD